MPRSTCARWRVARRPASTALAALAGLAALLAGCGGGGTHSPSQRAVKAVAASYVHALAHGQYASACSQLTVGATAKVARTARHLTITAPTCEGQLSELVSAIPEPQRTEILAVERGASIGAVHVGRDTATADVQATFRGQRHGFPLALRLEGGVWKVDADISPAAPAAA